MNKSYSNLFNSSFWLLTIGVFCALILPQLVQDGMFLDGVFYASISKNLAHHLGTFWNLHYSQTFYSSLHEQPPLMFWLQGQFFGLFGDSIYVERIYSFLTAIITAFGINLIWKEIFRNNNDLKQHGWLPVLFWIIIPICFWSYINNLEECTMSLFDVFAIYFIIKAINKDKIIYLLLGGSFIFLASFTKGIQGLFPLIILSLRYFINKDISFKKSFIYSLIVLLIPTLLYLYFYSNPIIRESYHQYFHRRLVLTFGNNETTTFRFYLLLRLILELIPVLLITFISIILLRKKFPSKDYFTNHNKDILFFLLIGLSASLPLMITLEQRGFYLTTSFPYFAIAFAIIAAPFLSSQIKSVSPKIFKGIKAISITLLIGTLVITSMQIGTTKRDEEMLHDIYLIGKEIPPQTIISSDRDLFYDWKLQAYFQRLCNISLDEDSLRTYHLIEKQNPKTTAPANYSKINLSTLKYDIYKKQ